MLLTKPKLLGKVYVLVNPSISSVILATISYWKVIVLAILLAKGFSALSCSCASNNLDWYDSVPEVLWFIFREYIASNALFFTSSIASLKI